MSQPALVASISGSTIWQWLSEDAIRPWRHRSWIFPRDLDFSTKAGRVLDLYARKFEDERLGPGEYVISSDEKTSLQARLRCHPTASAGPRRPLRVEHEYTRGGAWAYLAAWDVHRAKLFGRLESTTGIEPFGRLVDQVMAVEPYRSADRVFWVVDNGSSHRGQAAADRLQVAHPAPPKPAPGGAQRPRSLMGRQPQGRFCTFRPFRVGDSDGFCRNDLIHGGGTRRRTLPGQRCGVLS